MRCKESLVSEIKRDVDRDLNGIQNIEEEAEEEQEAGRAVDGLHDLAGNAAEIADQQEDLKKQALALGRAGDQRFADGDRPRQAEAENRQRFK